jgi:hypothetical protein
MITITVTLYATNADNVLFSHVVQKSYSLQVKSCGTSVFNSPTIATSNFADPLNWAYNINSQIKTMTFSITDTISVLFESPTYCGGRTITLTVASSETNPLAAQLLSCAPSCLTATQDATGYVLSLSLNINEVIYADTVLHFTCTVKFTNYVNTP